MDSEPKSLARGKIVMIFDVESLNEFADMALAGAEAIRHVCKEGIELGAKARDVRIIEKSIELGERADILAAHVNYMLEKAEIVSEREAAIVVINACDEEDSGLLRQHVGFELLGRFGRLD